MAGRDASPRQTQPDNRNDQLAMMELVFQITRRFASSLDLNVLLGQVLSLMVDSLTAERGTIFVFDQEGKVIRHILSRRNLPPEESEQVVSTVLDRGLAGWVMRNRRAALVQDTKDDPRWHHLAGDESITRSAIAVPLLHRGKLNGLLTLVHPEAFAFTREHLDLASAIAGQAATAIENARLFTHVREERAVLEALINGVQEPIIVTDTLNRIRYANSAAAALDPTLKDAVGQPVESVLHSDKLNAMFRAMRTSGQPQGDQLTWPDGRSFDVNMVLLPDVGSVAVMHDVTHFRELDRMKSEFVATVSHDLKAPLTVIYGYVELLQQALPDLDDFARTSLEEIQASAARMRDLITTLLDLAQIEAGFDRVQQACSIRAIILDALQLHRLTAEDKDITLQVEVPDSLPTVQGHPVRLGQAVNNLLVNALKYTPPQGRVTVSAQADDDQITVRVADTGPGIPVAKQTGLFSKFYRLDVRGTDEEEGHGLGLAIVRSVVEAHGGRVWVDSAEGEGSTFGFSLPIANTKGNVKDAKE